MRNIPWYKKEIPVKKEWLLLLFTVMVTLLITVTGIRWFAPQLLGVPMDLRLVKTAKELPPFFDGIFRLEDYTHKDFIIEDPVLKRAKPLFPNFQNAGPHDILGFRNRMVPNTADIITIGDSQTYGNNALIERNWPGYLHSNLQDKQSATYNMSVGGWAAPQYLEIFYKATFFRPRLIVVAFYTGNDPQESFIHAYGNDRWAFLRPDTHITAADSLKGVFPVPESQWLPVTFKDGTKTIFTPAHRSVSNMDHPSVKAGYEIMARVAEHIQNVTTKLNIQLVFTIIPTKELVFAKKVSKDQIDIRQDYIALVRNEAKNVEILANRLKKIPGSTYVDVLNPLQDAALSQKRLYPKDKDGHPLGAGYMVIGAHIASKIKTLLPEKSSGVFRMSYLQKPGPVYLIHNNQLWNFASKQLFLQNGWTPEDIKKYNYRDIANLPHGGLIERADPTIFGPSK